MTILTIEFKKGSSQTWQKAPIQMRSNSLISRKASQLAMLEGWTAWRITMETRIPYPKGWEFAG